jgi:hypothetical protein
MHSSRTRLVSKCQPHCGASHLHLFTCFSCFKNAFCCIRVACITLCLFIYAVLLRATYVRRLCLCVYSYLQISVLVAEFIYLLCMFTFSGIVDKLKAMIHVSKLNGSQTGLSSLLLNNQNRSPADVSWIKPDPITTNLAVGTKSVADTVDFLSDDSHPRKYRRKRRRRTSSKKAKVVRRRRRNTVHKVATSRRTTTKRRRKYTRRRR